MKNNKLDVVIFGSTGMVGKAVLLECIESSDVQSILLISRRTAGIANKKITEVVCENLFDLASLDSEIREKIKKVNACFICLGVSSAGMSEEKYNHLTYDLTLGIARYLVSVNKNMTICYVSGAGTDSSEIGKVMWARVKGKTENELLGMGFKDAYMFRPAFIQPMKGVTSKTMLYRIFYMIFKPFYLFLKNFRRPILNPDVLRTQRMYWKWNSV